MLKVSINACLYTQINSNGRKMGPINLIDNNLGEYLHDFGVDKIS